MVEKEKIFERVSIDSKQLRVLAGDQNNMQIVFQTFVRESKTSIHINGFKREENMTIVVLTQRPNLVFTCRRKVFLFQRKFPLRTFWGLKDFFDI